MSAGPIQQERASWKAIRVSTPDNARVCMAVKGKSYCGRSSVKERTDDWRKVVCWDCVSAALADGVRLPKGVAA